MLLTDDKELQYGYFSQTLLPNYIEEHGVVVEQRNLPHPCAQR